GVEEPDRSVAAARQEVAQPHVRPPRVAEVPARADEYERHVGSIRIAATLSDKPIVFEVRDRRADRRRVNQRTQRVIEREKGLEATVRPVTDAGDRVIGRTVVADNDGIGWRVTP